MKLKTRSILLAATFGVAQLPIYATTLKATPDQLYLTDGYDSQKQMYIAAGGKLCLHPGSQHYAGNVSNLISFSNSTSYDEIKKDLDVETSSHISIGLFSASEESSFIKATEDDAYSQTFYYSEILLMPGTVYEPDQYGTGNLSATGLAAFNSSDPTQFEKTCGDYFVQQQQLGGSLILAMKIKFNSASDKQTFSLNAKAGLGSLFDATGNIKGILNKTGIKANIEFYLYQKGGQPEELPEAFKKEAGKGYHNLQCSIDNFDECQAAVSDLIDYAKGSFPKQFVETSGGVKPNPAVLKTVLQPYASIGITKSQVPLSQAIINARKYLGQTAENTNKKLEFFKHYLTSPLTVSPHMTEQTQSEVNGAISKLQSDLNLLEAPSEQDGAIKCYSDPDQCLIVLSELQSKMHDNDSTINNLYKALKVSYLSMTSGPPYPLLDSGQNLIYDHNVLTYASLYYPISVNTESALGTNFDLSSDDSCGHHVIITNPPSVIQLNPTPVSFTGPNSDDLKTISVSNISDTASIYGVPLLAGNCVSASTFVEYGEKFYYFLMPVETPI